MEEKKISKVEFDEAVKQAIREQVNDPDIEGMGKLLIPMMGMLFASKVKEILFGKED
jgi:hypothetical protein